MPEEPIGSDCAVEFDYKFVYVVDCTGRSTGSTEMKVVGDPSGSGGVGHVGTWNHLGFQFVGGFEIPSWSSNTQGLRYGSLSLFGEVPGVLPNGISMTFEGSGDYVSVHHQESTQCPTALDQDCSGNPLSLLWIATDCAEDDDVP